MIREVWYYNVVEQFSILQQLSDGEYSKRFPLISIDVVYPGTVFKITDQPFDTITPRQQYALMKQNVEALNIIQLGLTLSDGHVSYVWQFNFSDFHPDRDTHDPDSIALLRNQGIDFCANDRSGIHSQDFAAMFSWICGPDSPGRNRKWITFHGLYDLGFLIKMLTGKPLPDRLGDFMSTVRYYFGNNVYDVKPIAEWAGLCGGLEKVATNLGLQRRLGKSHQGGSDSLVAMEAFVRLVMQNQMIVLCTVTYLIYGLTWLPKRTTPM